MLLNVCAYCRLSVFALSVFACAGQDSPSLSRPELSQILRVLPQESSDTARLPSGAAGDRRGAPVLLHALCGAVEAVRTAVAQRSTEQPELSAEWDELYSPEWYRALVSVLATMAAGETFGRGPRRRGVERGSEGVEEVKTGNQGVGRSVAGGETIERSASSDAAAAVRHYVKPVEL